MHESGSADRLALSGSVADDPEELAEHVEDWHPSETRTTFRQLVVRAVAVFLLASLLGSLYLAFRGVEDIVVVIGILLVVALVARMARKQREAENPYRTADPPDYGGT